jgi:glucokinase
MDLSMIGHSVFLTIDAGGTYLKSAVINIEGEVLNGSGLMIKAYSGGSKEKILFAFRETILKGLKFIDINGMKLQGIGLAFPGPFDYSAGVPQMEHKFLNIFGVRLRDLFHEIPGVPPGIPINFINDAHAVLSGELWKGNAMGFANAAVVTLGTGLGFAFSRDGIVQCNSWGGPPVTIFRIPYKGGILEDFTARRGFLKIYSEISGKETEGTDVSDIGKWADEGDESSIRTFWKVGAILAEAIHDILIEKEIQCLLLGGQISKSFHHMKKTLSKGLSDIECLKKISMVKSIDNAALLGALKSFQERV